MSDKIDLSTLDWESAEGSELLHEEFKANTGAAFPGPRYLRLQGSEADKGKGDRVYLRYLTDWDKNADLGVMAWINTHQHSMVPTKAKPADMPADRKWPASMSAVCRETKLFLPLFPQGCWIHQNVKDPKARKTAVHGWALAVERVPVIGDGSEELGGPRKKGVIVRFEDKMREVLKVDDEGKPLTDEKGEMTGETVEEVSYLIVNQKWTNYFGGIDGLARNYGTALDRDYLVIRTGTGLDTEYQHIPQDPMEYENSEGKTERLDLRDPEVRSILYPDMPDLRELVYSQVSDEHYNRWFIPGEGGAAASTGGGTSKAEAEAPTPTTGQTADRVASLRDRLKTRS